jgi:AcrR family transcriptional regulator
MIKKRLTSEERRERIIEAARQIFSEKGFHGTTTKELAQKAAVSEALIFQHFPSKDAIYSAMLASCRKNASFSEAYKLLELQPSTSTLAVMLHFIATRIVFGDEDARMSHRLLLRSLSENGSFAKVIFKHVGSTWVAKLNACAQAAQKTGDMRISSEKLKNGGWLVQHLMLMLSFVHVPSGATIDYKSTRDKLARDAVIFCMRGLGISDEAIEKYYNPEALALLTA